jgi:WS/DGAT/MGAT family acyltransferase
MKMNTMRLSAQDAAFIYGEDQRIPLHVGCLVFMEAGPLRREDGAIDIGRIRAEIAKRLHLAPLFRKRLAHVPFDQGRPVWVDDPRFAIDHHVHLTAVPQPGSRRQVLDLMGRLQAAVLDRNKPLWEIYFVDGLEGGDTVAVMAKVHHAMVDGTTGVELGVLIFNLTPETTPVDVPPWEPSAEPSAAGLLLGAFVDHAADAARRARKVAGALVDVRKPVQHAFKVAHAVETLASDFDPLPFNRPVGSRRAFDFAQVPLDEVHDARRALGATVNDIGLAAVTGALRCYCSESGIDPESLRRIKAICPVDNRAPGDRRPGSDVSSMIVDLPVDEADLRARVARIVERLRTLKRLDVAEGVNMWARATSLLPATLLRATSWLQFRGLMGNANLLISNVRGPTEPIYCFGAKVHTFHPYFGVQDGLGLNVVLFSYAGQLLIGIGADPDLVPGIGAFAESIVKSFGELAAAA